MNFIKIDDIYVNIEKIICIYERIEYSQPSEIRTVIEIEGFCTGNTGPYGETPYYEQNKIVTKMPIQEVFNLLDRRT